MRTPLVFLFLLGCGASGTSPTAASVTLPSPPSASAPPPTDGAVEARLGCTVILRADVDREFLAGKKLSDKPPNRETVRDHMIRAVVVKKLAGERELTVSPSEIDGGIAAMAKDSNITPEQLMASVREHDVDETRYRAQVGETLLEMKLRIALAGGTGSGEKAVMEKSDPELERATKALLASECVEKPVR